MEPINRRLLKENGKLALKNNFWMIMLMVFVGSVLGANWSGLLNGGSNASFRFQYNTEYTGGAGELFDFAEKGINYFDDRRDFHYDYNSSYSTQENINGFLKEVCDYYNINEQELFAKAAGFIGLIIVIILFVNLLAVCLQFLLGSFLYAPIGVGYRQYFMKNRKGEAAFNNLFSAFSSGRYMKVVKTMFATNIRIFGWSLLLYFPGMVKYYEYYFVPYIVAENPDISMERARQLSSEMANGHKWQMFILELSFIGWILLFILAEVVLALISCGLLAIPGILLIYPINGYIVVTMAELYAERREYALMVDIASNEELIGF